MVRYNSNGLLDETFGNSGRVVTPLYNGAIIKEILIQSDGSIIAAGHTEGDSSHASAYLLAHYSAFGVLDMTFGQYRLRNGPLFHWSRKSLGRPNVGRSHSGCRA